MEKDLTYRKFLAELDNAVRGKWFRKTGALAKRAGISQGNLSKIINRKVIPGYETQEKILDAIGIDLRTIFESSQPQTKSTNVVEFQSDAERQHFKVIQTFQDPETALQFNHFLSKLEKIDVKEYERILGEVRGLVRDHENKQKDRDQEAPPKRQIMTFDRA